MRPKWFLLIIVALFFVVHGAAADEVDLAPITPANVAEIQQLRILNNVPAWDVDWNPAGNQLAIGTLDGVLLCSCDSFENPEVLTTGINAYRISYSPDGRLLAVGTASTSPEVQLWDLASGSLRYTVTTSASVASLEFSYDGRYIAAGLSSSRGVTLIDVMEGQEIAHYPAEIAVDTLAFTVDDSAIIYPAESNLLRRQSLSDQTAVDLPTSCTPTDLQISPDGTRLAGTTFDCCVTVMDLADNNELFRTTCGQSFTLDFNPDGSLLVTGNQDGTLHFLDVEAQTEIATISGHQDKITRLVFHPDGTRIVTAGLDDTVRVFGILTQSELAENPCGVIEIAEGEPSGEILYHAVPTMGGAGDSYHVLAWCGDHQILLSGALFPVWSPDGERMAFQYINPDTGQYDGLWIADADGSNLHPVAGSEPQDRAPSWSPDGTQLVFESVRDGESGIYTVELDSERVMPLISSAQTIYERPVWSPDGNSIVYIVRQIAARGETRYLYQMGADGNSPHRLTDLDHVLSAQWSPDGTMLVLAAELEPFQSSILVLNAETGEYQRLTQGFADTQPVWSPDQHFIAFVHGDTLMLIQADGENERVLLRLPGTVGSTGVTWKKLSDD